ncbi:MAG: tripartite tricarboxylate transporter permease [Burkholderiales bacterium]
MDSVVTEASFMLNAAGNAFVIMMEPTRLAFLSLGAFLGLILGILPGVGGLAGTAMLLPFTFSMDPYTAFAFLLGLGSTVATGDPIPAVLFGVPGGAASAATVLDGYPMAKRGEAGRALSAAYMSSLMGGIFGAALLAVSIPILRPTMLYIGSPELLAFAVFGISMVAVLSGRAPLRGLAAACLGIMIAMIGADPQTGTLRWTFDTIYLWEGLPLLPIVLGLFALPEMCDLLIARTAIASGGGKLDIYKGQWQGVKDCFANWWLIVRCSWIGGGIGSIPGISASVVDWLAYGHALRTEKGAAQTFGKGDVRGVIASESSNNAKEGGALVPTIAFGVPGSASMAILMGAFMIHGLVPGPDMLNKHLDVTYSMVWSIALANLLGAGLCYAFSPQFARVALLRYTLICPAILGIIYIGAFESSRNWGDLYTLFFFGLLGWIMKQFKWPRPPLILGLVLGDLIERYMFISVERYGLEWLTRPLVMVLFALAFIGLVRPLLEDYRAQGGLKGILRAYGPLRFEWGQLFTVVILSVFIVLVVLAWNWRFNAKIVPMVVGGVAITAIVLSLINQMFRKAATEPGMGAALAAAADAPTIGGSTAPVEKIHMDIESDTAHLPVPVIIARAAMFFGYLLAFMGSTYLIGLIPTLFCFVIAFMRIEARERWNLVITYAVCMVVFVTIVFDRIMKVPWPASLLGEWFPLLKVIPSL